jgi:hypothetical protein
MSSEYHNVDWEGMHKAACRWYGILEFSIEIEIKPIQKSFFLERYSDNLKDLNGVVDTAVEDCIRVYYNALEEFIETIESQPTERVAENQLMNLSELPHWDKLQFYAIQYLRGKLTDANRAHTDAYNYINEHYHSKKDKHKGKQLKSTFKWLKGDVELLFKELKASELIESSLESFKKGFNGGNLDEVQYCHKFNMTDNLIVYLYNQLDDEGFIDFNNLPNNAIICQLSGVKSAGAKRTNYQNNKNHKPKGSSKIDKIIETLNQFI